jgi:hypothetical protein
VGGWPTALLVACRVFGDPPSVLHCPSRTSVTVEILLDARGFPARLSEWLGEGYE